MAGPKKQAKAADGERDPDAGDPELMLWRIKSELVPTSHREPRTQGFVVHSTVVDLKSSDFYVIECDQVLRKVREARNNGQSSKLESETSTAFDARNPLLFEQISQAAAIAEELATKPEGTFPSRLIGSAFNPRRILPVLQTVRDHSPVLFELRGALASVTAAEKAVRAAITELERGVVTPTAPHPPTAERAPPLIEEAQG